jgi:hypothetical protein
MNKKPTQCERVLEYMRKHGGITDNDAHEHLRINRLSGRIHELRKSGYNIVMDWKKSKNPYNEWTRYGFYRLEDKNAGHIE